jgi:cell division protease FtsH
MSGLGFVGYGKEDEPLFLGREITQHKEFSDDTARRIDAEVIKILDEAMAETRSLLTEHRNQLDKLTEALIEHETLDDDEIRKLLGFEPAEHSTKFV